MSCDFPLKGFRSTEKHPSTGNPRLTFNPLKAINSTNPISIPCGRCTGCRLERSRQWAIRAMHEAELYRDNCFITLTYSKEHLPADYSINVRVWQLFMKRLRKSLGSKRIRFLASGEYGEKNLRPHYHAIIFNHTFPDALLYRDKTADHERLYTSTALSEVWPYGLATLGDVTFESAAYVARYNMKKIAGENSGAFYLRQNPDTGFYHQVEPEFLVMSRRPGLGADWIKRFKPDVYPDDFVLARGAKSSPPRFYDQQLTEEELEQTKRRRKRLGLRYKPHQTNERRRARVIIRDQRISLLKRQL